VDTDLKIILLDHQNNYVGNSSIMSNAAKSFDILTTNLSVLHNYFDSPTIIFIITISSYIFRYFSKNCSFRKNKMTRKK